MGPSICRAELYHALEHINNKKGCGIDVKQVPRDHKPNHWGTSGSDHIPIKLFILINNTNSQVPVSSSPRIERKTDKTDRAEFQEHYNN